MNNDMLLLKEVAKLRDIVDLGICSYIYQACNGVQFRNMPASDFIYFLNLKLPKDNVCPLPREKQRICYMVYAVACTITPANFAQHWVQCILELCDISLEYYDKHHKDVVSISASKKNKEYCKLIDDAIKRGY